MSLAPSLTISCRAFHPDLSINYQPNRFCEARPTSVTELTAAAPRITGDADYTRELLALSDSPERTTMSALTLAGTGSLCNLPVKRRQTSRNVIGAIRPQCASTKIVALKPQEFARRVLLDVKKDVAKTLVIRTSLAILALSYTTFSIPYFFLLEHHGYVPTSEAIAHTTANAVVALLGPVVIALTVIRDRDRSAAGSSGDGFTWRDRGHDPFIGLDQSRNGSPAGFRHG